MIQPRPFQGQFVIGKLGIATMNMCIKFDIYMFHPLQGIQAMQNVETGVLFGGFGVPQSHQQHNHSTECI